MVEAAVVAVPHDTLGEDVAAALVTVGSTTDVDVRWALREELGEHQMPRKIVVLDELPRGPTGKVDKRELMAVLAEDSVGWSYFFGQSEGEVKVDSRGL